MPAARLLIDLLEALEAHSCGPPWTLEVRRPAAAVAQGDCTVVDLRRGDGERVTLWCGPSWAVTRHRAGDGTVSLYPWVETPGAT